MFPYEVTAAAAICLGSKEGNAGRQTMFVVKSLLKVLGREVPNQEICDALVQEVNLVEQVMATTIGFDFGVGDLYKHIPKLAKAFEPEQCEPIFYVVQLVIINILCFSAPRFD